jgi:methionyl-tRNA formyltransferase
MSARVVFMGTPAFALPSLEALIRHYNVVGVVTQPDREAGRGRALTPPPVKTLALQHGIPVIQPKTLRDPAAVEQIRAWAPDVIVVAAFGQLLRQNVLAIPPHGCLNVHASLLPKYRGAAPIPAAILNGDAVTGVTIMRIDPGLDTGPIVAQREEAIRPDDTAGALAERLAALGAALLVEVLPRWLAGAIQATPQDDNAATLAPQLQKEAGRLDWTRSAVELERQVRAFSPWPGTFTSAASLGGAVLHVRAAALSAVGAQFISAASPLRGEPGQVVALNGGRIGVVTGAGVLELKEVQLAGKRAMAAAEFARGWRDFVGARLA